MSRRVSLLTFVIGMSLLIASVPAQDPIAAYASPAASATPPQSITSTVPQQQQSQYATLTTNQTKGLNTYENPVYGFAFDFPLDWQLDKFTSTGPVEDKIIGIESAKSASIPSGTIGSRTGFDVSVGEVSTYLDPKSLEVKPLSARDYAVDWLNTMSSLSSLHLSITQDVVNSASTVLANESNAWRQEYITNIEGGQAIFNSEIYVVKDGRIYKLSFHTDPLSVPENLPIGKEIVDSFRFIS
jgi:hypothetical protein